LRVEAVEYKMSGTNSMNKNAVSIRWTFVVLMIIGILSRIVLLGKVPGGINQDEAYATYEAYSLIETGIDSRGYVNPVYFVAWGSGMNALLTYILIPFVKIMGLTVMTPRLPMAIISILTLPAFYGVMRRITNERIALIGLFLLAVSPWHIGLSRWALESNLSPAFLMFALYFYLRTLEKPEFAPACGLMYGLCLYCYALMWIVVPLILVMSLSYSFIRGEIKKQALGWYLAGGIILLVLAVPLILFVLINKDLLPEIRTAYFSIPHLISGRMDEVSLANIPENIHKTLYMFFIQADSDIFHASPRYGFYHHISIVFFPIGFIACCVQTYKRKKSAYILFHFLASVPIGILVNIAVQRINGIHIPILALTALGIDVFSEWFKTRKQQVLSVIIAVYCLFFIRFEYHYFTDYGDDLTIVFQDGLEDGIRRAKELAGDDTIYVSDAIYYSRILFYDKFDPKEFQKTKEWGNLKGDEKYQFPLRFGRWTYKKEDITDSTVCLLDIPMSYENPFRNMEREEYKWIAVMKPGGGNVKTDNR